MTLEEKLGQLAQYNTAGTTAAPTSAGPNGDGAAEAQSEQLTPCSLLSEATPTTSFLCRGSGTRVNTPPQTAPTGISTNRTCSPSPTSVMAASVTTTSSTSTSLCSATLFPEVFGRRSTSSTGCSKTRAISSLTFSMPTRRGNPSLSLRSLTCSASSLMPRIRSWKSLRFYRPGPEARFDHIDPLFTGNLDWTLVETHLPDMLRIVLSIKAGRISASTIPRRLGTYSRKNRLYQAFSELGRVIRTGFLLRYISEPELRRTIQGATNKSESPNRENSGVTPESSWTKNRYSTRSWPSTSLLE